MAMENITSSLGMKAQSKNEDKVTSVVEHYTARVPSLTFLGVASGAAIASGVLFLLGEESIGLKKIGLKDIALFIGQWVPTFLLLGIYNKIVKTSEDVSTSGVGSGAVS